MAAGSRGLTDDTEENNGTTLPSAIVQLDSLAEMLKLMDAALQGAEIAQAFKIDMTSEVKSWNLLSRIEKLEALLLSVCGHCDGLENSQSQLLKEVAKQKAKINSQETKIGELQNKVLGLETKNDNLQKSLKVFDQSHSFKLSHMSSDIKKSVEFKMHVLEGKNDHCTQRISGLEMKVKLAENQINDLSALQRSMKYKFDKCANTVNGTMKEQLDELAAKYHQLCHLLAIKVIHLEKLRDALNKAHAKVTQRSILETQSNAYGVAIEKLKRQVTELNRSKSQCERHRANMATLQTQMLQTQASSADCQAPARDDDGDLQIGFTAQLPRQWHYKQGFTLRCMYHVSCNEGKCFNAKKGIFTAPRDGLYCFALTIQQARNDSFTAVITRNNFNGCDYVTSMGVKGENTYSIVAPVFLHKDDDVYVEIIKADKPFELTEYTTFCGWLVV